jgi:hypothetical protein
MSTGMDELGKAIADGKVGFAESLDMLMSAHIRLFGTPNTRGGIYRLEARITEQLSGVIEKWADPHAREWYQPRLIPMDIKNDWGVER